MSNRHVSTVGIVMPPDFAVAPYRAIHVRISTTIPTSHIAWPHYAGGWNALVYRFRACADHATAFTQSMKRAGKVPPPNERYVQERELFGFFVTGVAAIDSLCYSLFALGAMLNLKEFPLSEPRQLKAITPKKTTEQFAAVFPNEAITTTLADVLHDARTAEWWTIRNILAHRAALGRHFTQSFPPQPFDEHVLWIEGTIPLDTATTSTRRAWLATTIRHLLNATDAFTAHHFPA